MDQSGGNSDQTVEPEVARMPAQETASIENRKRPKDAKTHPAEEDSVLHKMQTSSYLQNEPRSLYQAKAEAIFPGPDTEKGKLNLKRPYKKGAARREVYKARLQPEVVGATSRTTPENHDGGEISHRHLSIGNKIHKKTYLSRPTKL
jgi:hypothetical protein